ncbi:MAG: helix-hairpin-helix domain-containing protein [Ferrimonas sp.]
MSLKIFGLLATFCSACVIANPATHSAVEKASAKASSMAAKTQLATMNATKALPSATAIVPANKRLSTTAIEAESDAITPKININTATAQELAEQLSGIGTVKAQAIVEYRQKHGKFKTLNDLATVKGIGATTIANNHGRITL